MNPVFSGLSGTEPKVLNEQIKYTDAKDREPDLVGAASINRGHFLRDPFSDNTFWTSAVGSGVFRSTDNGVTWYPRNHGLLNLLVDNLQADPVLPNVLYALLIGSSHLYVTSDAGASWQPRAVCTSSWSPAQDWMEFSIGQQGGLKSLWALKAGISSQCGLMNRSDDEGHTWCAFSTFCPGSASSPPSYSPLCPAGINQIIGNDGLAVFPIEGTNEAYFTDDKQQLEWNCKGTSRTESTAPAAVMWKDRVDKFVDPVSLPTDPGLRCTDAMGEFHKMRPWQLDFDPEDPDQKFAGLRMFNQGTPYCRTCSGNPNPAPYCRAGNAACCCRSVADDPAYWPDTNLCPGTETCEYAHPYSLPNQLWELHIAYTDGSLNLGRRAWKSAFDVKACFNIPKNGGANAQVIPIEFAFDNSAIPAVKEIFALGHQGGPVQESVWYCDASTDTSDCFSDSNWKCAWNFTTTTKGCPAPSSFECEAGDVDWWNRDKSSFMRNLGFSRTARTNGHFDVLFKTRRPYARDEFLRVEHDGTDWVGKALVDPVTCANSGPELFTPVQVIEISPAELITVSQRQWFRTTNGGASWNAWNPMNPVGSGFWIFERAPRLEQAPSNPAWLYAWNAAGVWLSKSSGTPLSWYNVSRMELAYNMCRDDWDSCTTGVQGGAPCHANTERCGQFNSMCGDVNDILVDKDNENFLFAANEAGVYRWEYPFDGSDPTPGCKPAIATNCLTDTAAAISGETWVSLQTCPPASGPCLATEGGITVIAQDPVNGDHLFAGGRNGLYESVNRGIDWDQRITGPLVYDVVIEASGNVLAGTDQGVYRRSLPAGVFINTLGPIDGLAIEVRDIAVDPTTPGLIYAASTDYIETTFHEGVYRSTDFGSNWQKITATLDSQRMMSVFVRSDGVAYAGRVGKGLLRIDPAGTVSPCGSLEIKTADGFPGSTRMGTAMAPIGSTHLTGGTDCVGDWASIAFVSAAPIGARLQILDREAQNLRIPAINPNVNLVLPWASVLGIGDRSGDGCPDIAAGFPRTTSGVGVVQFLDACDAASPIRYTLPPPAGGGDDRFGLSLARSGDLVAIGAPNSFDPKVYIYDLSVGYPPVLVGTMLAPIGANDFGWSLAFGDLNNDGLTDLAVGAPDVDPNGQVFGPGQVHIYAGPNWFGAPTRTLAGQMGAAFGMSLSSGHDRLGVAGPDGSDDLAIGAPGENGITGAVYWLNSLSDPTPMRLAGQDPLDQFGWSVLLTQDAISALLADSLPDLLVGAPGRSESLARQGGVYFYEGAAFTCKTLGTAANGEFGTTLANAGDLDANRWDDVLIGQPQPDGVTEGRVFLGRVMR